MKPANFPDRVQQRRRRAMQREGFTPAKALELAPPARGVRTKKDRRNRAKVR